MAVRLGFSLQFHVTLVGTQTLSQCGGAPAAKRSAGAETERGAEQTLFRVVVSEGGAYS